MTDEQDGHPGQPRRQPVDDPTVMDPSTGHLHGPTPEEPALPAPSSPPPDNPAALPHDEPTVADPTPWPGAPAAATPASPDDPTLATPAPTWPDGPRTASTDDATIAVPTPAWPSGPAPGWPDGPTVATPVDQAAPGVAVPAWSDGPTVATPIDEVTIPAGDPDDPTTAVVDESPTTTGPTVASWPLDELLPPPPTDLIWRPDAPEPPPPARRPAYYIALGAAVVLVVALIAAAALVTVMRPTKDVAGSAKPTQGVPDITGVAPPTTPPSRPPRQGPGEHPLSTSPARMADATCALPRFDLADDRQAAFYAAAKVCADSAWRGVLDEAGLQATVEVVTVTSPVRTRSCGEITPGSPSTQCDGTVYMTPAHLRDTEQNGRYPGRYFGVFLREYARAVQFTTGLSESAPATDDGETRLAQQATCLAGIASGSMANRGAVDANIIGEISDRLSAVDAPPDAKAMLDKGFQERTLKSCDAW